QHSSLSTCFRPSVAHRASHSFPTRRSSDLPLLTVGALGKFQGDRIDEIRGIGHVGFRQRLGVSLVIEGRVRSRDRHVDSQCQGEDRKSTRLNSSHVSISYAVFCLKKKIPLL